MVPPTADDWRTVLQELNLTREQSATIVAARRSLLAELRRVAAEWQQTLSTLALQLLQVPRDQWHKVAAVQAMVSNLAAEREAVVAFLHTIMDEVCAVCWGVCCAGACRALVYVPAGPLLSVVAAAATRPPPKKTTTGADAAAGGPAREQQLPVVP